MNRRQFFTKASFLTCLFAWIPRPSWSNNTTEKSDTLSRYENSVLVKTLKELIDRELRASAFEPMNSETRTKVSSNIDKELLTLEDMKIIQSYRTHVYFLEPATLAINLIVQPYNSVELIHLTGALNPNSN